MKNEEISFNKTSGGYSNQNNKGLVAGLSIALVLVVVAGAILLTQAHKQKSAVSNMLENQKVEMAGQLNQRDSIINEWVVAFNEIESDIKKITARENMLNLQSMDPEISKDKKAEILKEISLIRDLIDQNRKKLASLNRQLRSSGIKIASMQSQVDSLTAHIAESDKYMTDLKAELVNRNFEIGQLNEKVSTMEVAITDSSSKISRQTEEMNKAFVVSGTYKDLKEKGLLIKEGGVLGLGKKESLQENFKNDELFTRIDITKTRTIAVNSKAAKLVTEHPANSYELVKDDEDRVAYIEIKDPANFWRISKYAVVEVNN